MFVNKTTILKQQLCYTNKVLEVMYEYFASPIKSNLLGFS